MRPFRTFILIGLFLTPILLLGQSAPSFNDDFINLTMRIDYFHVGNAGEEIITLDQIYEEGVWAGSAKNLIDNFDNGRYYAKIYDYDSGRLIFSKGYDSYFGEYKTTDPALRGEQRAYHESVLIPYPRRKVYFTIEKRNRQNILSSQFRRAIDPADIAIIKEKPEANIEVIKALINGDPQQKVDLVIIGEGYRSEEEAKFKKDLERYVEVFFNWEPYKSYRNSFNIYGVLKPSTESGCDEPRQGLFRNTALNSSFNSLNLDRYLLLEDNRTLRNVAAAVPYDAIMVMVNIKRYGGGGLYNQYSAFTSDGEWNEHVFHHEFGHSFAGLADEYYSADIAYNDFYPKGIEPREPNITALLDPKNLKWKDLASPGIEIPTLWEKEEFDNLYINEQLLKKEYEDKKTELEGSKAPEEEKEKVREGYRVRLDELNRKMKNILLTSPYRGKVGAFEGAGFSAKGLYRPMLNCVMLKYMNEDKNFCRVCEHSIVRIINYFCE